MSEYTDQAKVSALFKAALRLADTDLARDFYREPYSVETPVFSSQVWAKADEIPTTAPVLADGATSGVVTYFEDRQMSAIPGVDNAFYLEELADAVPFNHADGSYAFSFKDSLDNDVPFGSGNWMWLPGWPIVAFYPTEDNLLPDNMPPKVTFYTYSGTKGASGNSNYRIVADISERDLIPVGEREEGLLCFVQSTDVTYQLVGGVTNSDWLLFTNNALVPSENLLGNNSTGSIQITEHAGLRSFILYYRADRDTLYSSGQIQVDYKDGVVNYTEIQGDLEELLGLTIDFNVDGDWIDLDWELTDDTYDVQLDFLVGNLIYGDNAVPSGDTMTKPVYDPQTIEADAFDVDNHTNGTTNKVYTAVDQTKLQGMDAGAQVNPTASAIKAQYESNTDTNAYTDSEKSKLAGLESSKFLGQYASLAALEAAHASPVEGSYGYVDAGVGQDTVLYIWDSSDDSYIEQQGESTAETPASIKSKYESNADTNAYTDTEKTKLSGIETGAEVNLDDAATKVLYESNADTNAYTDAEKGKLATVESGAEVNPSDAEVKTAYENNADTNAFTDDEKTAVGQLPTEQTVTALNNTSGSVVVGSTSTDVRITLQVAVSRNAEAYAKDIFIVWDGTLDHCDEGDIFPYIAADVDLGVSFDSNIDGSDIELTYVVDDNVGDAEIRLSIKTL